MFILRRQSLEEIFFHCRELNYMNLKLRAVKLFCQLQETGLKRNAAGKKRKPEAPCVIE